MTHWLRVELDEGTGKVTARLFCCAGYGPEGKQRDVTVHRDVELPESVRTEMSTTLQSVIDAYKPALVKEAFTARAAAELEAWKRGEFDEPAKKDEQQTAVEPK